MAPGLLPTEVATSEETVTMPQSSAFGLYQSTKALHFGAEALRAARFRHTDISVMYSDGQQALRLRESVPVATDVADEEPTTLGGILTTLSSMGAVVMPADGPFMAGGPILATLTGGGESLLATLRELGLGDQDIESFEDRLKAGGLLLSVQCDDGEWAARACEILARTGAERVAAV
jgi:hypothetical protein